MEDRTEQDGKHDMNGHGCSLSFQTEPPGLGFRRADNVGRRIPLERQEILPLSQRTLTTQRARRCPRPTKRRRPVARLFPQSREGHPIIKAVSRPIVMNERRRQSCEARGEDGIAIQAKQSPPPNITRLLHRFTHRNARIAATIPDNGMRPGNEERNLTRGGEKANSECLESS